MPESPAPATSANTSAERSLAGSWGRILVVDDNARNLLAVEAALGELANELVKAHSGEEALRALLDKEFALVLLDVQMPGLDGYETARLIRDRERTRHLPIIFLTAYDRDQDEVRDAYRLGAVDFLFKPLDPEILRAKASVFVTLERRAAELARRELSEERARWETRALRTRTAELAALLAEKEQVERALTAANTKLATADRRKDEFLAVLAHELRNPLSSVVTGLELLREPAAHALRDRTLSAMERQTDRLCHMIDDLLDVSRITSGKVALKLVPVDLREVVGDSIATVERALAARQHLLEVELPDAPIMLHADPVRLVQIATNLLQNAIRYTDAGGQLRVSCRSENGVAVLEVSDNGRGIPPDLLERVFDLFVQHGVGGSDGLGLGLALVQRLVQLHGGEVRAFSRGEGTGSSFHVHIPLCKETRSAAHAPQTASTSTPSRSVTPRRSQATPRVLVIEDNEDARDLLCELLRRVGYDVDSAADGAAGLDMLLSRRPDVALVDISLPELTGYQIAERVRSAFPAGGPRLIALTGYGQESDQERAHDVGFDAFLVKPAALDDLVRALAPS